MSLVPFGIRVCTVRAIQAALPESITVLDSPQSPLSQLGGDEPSPVIAIYTGFIENELEGRNLIGGDPSAALSIQIFTPSSFTFDVGNGLRIPIDTRRQGAETALDVISRKILLALDSSEEKWAHLWREFVQITPKMTNSSYVLEQDDVRASAREIVIDCSPIHEPIPGGEPILAWAELIRLMRDDKNSDGLSRMANWVESEIRGSKYLDKDGQDAAYIGLSEYVYRKLQGDMEPHVNIFPNASTKPLFDNTPLTDIVVSGTDDLMVDK